jgi:hypothetical protein
MVEIFFSLYIDKHIFNTKLGEKKINKFPIEISQIIKWRTV